MCRAHRVIFISTVIAWAGALALMFVPLAATGNARALAMVAAVNLGALAACLTTVSVLPYLLRDMFDRAITDYMGTYLAGWAARDERDAPTEPTRKHLDAVR